MTTRDRQRIGYSGARRSLLLAFCSSRSMRDQRRCCAARASISRRTSSTRCRPARRSAATRSTSRSIFISSSRQEASGQSPQLRAYATRVARDCSRNSPRTRPRASSSCTSSTRCRSPKTRIAPSSSACRRCRRRPGRRSVYFGLAGTNSVGTTDTIPFFEPDREGSVPRVRRGEARL